MPTAATSAQSTSGSTAATIREVVKVGGKELGSLAALWQELRARGPVVVVHGGGDAITQAGGQASFYRGRRVTDAATAALAAEILTGIGERLEREAAAAGLDVVRVAAGVGTAIPLEPLDLEHYGRVGVPRGVDRVRLLAHLAEGSVLLVTPVGRHADGGWLNVNADDMAAHLAAALGVPFFSFTDVPGVLVEGRLRRRLAADEALGLMAAGVIQGGMVAKVEAALAAVQGGAPFAWIGPLTEPQPIAWARALAGGTLIGGDTDVSS